MTNIPPMHLVPAYQKINNKKASCADSVYGVEFLARWVSNGKVCIPTDVRIIDWAEIDLQMITTLFHCFDFSSAKFQLAFINVSNETLSEDEAFKAWLSMLKDLRERSGKEIVVEITEMITPANLYGRWDDLKTSGFKMALDDFGVYHSKLKRLQSYTWDYCKFDETLSFSADTCKAIEFCNHHSITMIAERIEDKNMRSVAKRRGLINQQGYYYHKPELISLSSKYEAQHVTNV